MKNNYLVIGVIVMVLVVGGYLIMQPTAVANNDTQASPVETVEMIGQVSEETEEAMDMEEEDTIVDVAVADGRFKTLVTALQTAGLAETLSGEGPFTVFAPTDEAFEQLPDGTLESLLEDEEELTSVLTYHVVSGKVMASEVAALSSVETVQGQELTIDSADGVMVNDAEVILTDIEASNGIIHVIDSVLLSE
jgi:uncharacterized surface protein with fasciclin (FAS1) repeats